MAATLLDLLLQGEINPHDLILWLDGASVVRRGDISLCFGLRFIVFMIIRCCNEGEKARFR